MISRFPKPFNVYLGDKEVDKYNPETFTESLSRVSISEFLGIAVGMAVVA